jgi:hypothetical protein
MMPVELKLITERTRNLIEVANQTIEYSTTIIEQSKLLILGINEKRLEREAARSCQPLARTIIRAQLRILAHDV